MVKRKGQKKRGRSGARRSLGAEKVEWSIEELKQEAEQSIEVQHVGGKAEGASTPKR